MSSHYDPIPIDSDGEDEHVSDPIYMTEDEARTTDRPHFFQPRAPDSEPEREEDDTGNTEQRTLPPVDRWLDPPADDRRAPASYRLWTRTLRTLQRWRDRIPYTPIPGEGGSSSEVRQDFLLDTTPIIVDKVARHDERLDMTEDVIVNLPGSEQFEELQQRMDDTEENVTTVDNNVQRLEARVEALTRELRDMETRMDRRLDECHTMTTMAQGFARDELRQIFRGNQ